MKLIAGAQMRLIRPIKFFCFEFFFITENCIFTICNCLSRRFILQIFSRTIIFAWILCSIDIAYAENRIALIIGNSKYANANRLDNPANDAAAIAKALSEAGFQSVRLNFDLDREAMVEVLRQFGNDADKADWALVYYAGHGIEVGGINYLLPVDVKLKNDRDVSVEAISLRQVQEWLEGAVRLRIVILDACRNNPFLTTMRRTLTSRSNGRGLGRPSLSQSGSLVAYSAAEGQIASDGALGQVNSPYVAAFIKQLAVPDVEVNLLFRRVRADVLRATSGEQEPATYESLPEDRFVFRQPTGVSAVPQNLAPVVPVPAITPSLRPAIEACDRLAASALDPDRSAGVPGVGFGDINSSAAISACKEATLTIGTEQTGDGAKQARRMHFQLGRAYEAGKAYGEAKNHYLKAAEAGSTGAMSNLAFLYRRGRGMPADLAVAKAWYEKAAALGDANAMRLLGSLYADGQGVSEDDAIARMWYERAALAGDGNAMRALGFLAANGRGGPRDFGLARSWYEKAAAAGHATAMFDLGFLYENGHGVPQNFAIARAWYEKAAASGETNAMYRLGLIHANGRGVPQNLAAAINWYEQAKANGHTGAAKELALLKK